MVLAIGIGLAFAFTWGRMVDGANAHAANSYHSSANGNTWFTYTVAFGGIGVDRSMALDRLGRPHISYFDYFSSTLRYATWDGRNWITESVASRGSNPSVALDSHDFPHIGYQGAGVRYIYWNGTSWISSTIDRAAFGANISIALDSKDVAHVTYGDNNSSALRYAHQIANGWYTTTIAGLGGGIASSLAIDSQDNPHIAYYEHRTLNYTYWTGSKWDTTVVDADGDVGSGPSMVLDENDHPHIAYRQYSPDRVKYAYWTGSEWMIEAVTGSEKSNWYVSLALDPQGNPHVCGWSLDTGITSCFHRQNGTWNGELVDRKTLGFQTLQYDAGGNPHLIYFTWRSPKETYVMYASKNKLATFFFNFLPVIVR